MLKKRSLVSVVVDRIRSINDSEVSGITVIPNGDGSPEIVRIELRDGATLTISEEISIAKVNTVVNALNQQNRAWWCPSYKPSAAAPKMIPLKSGVIDVISDTVRQLYGGTFPGFAAEAESRLLQHLPFIVGEISCDQGIIDKGGATIEDVYAVVTRCIRNLGLVPDGKADITRRMFGAESPIPFERMSNNKPSVEENNPKKDVSDGREIENAIIVFVDHYARIGFILSEDRDALKSSLRKSILTIIKKLSESCSAPYSYDDIQKIICKCCFSIIQPFRSAAVKTLADGVKFGNYADDSNEVMREGQSIDSFAEMVKHKIHTQVGYWISQKHIPTPVGQILRMRLTDSIQDIINLTNSRSDDNSPQHKVTDVICVIAEKLLNDVDVIASYSDPNLYRYDHLTGGLKMVCEIILEDHRLTYFDNVPRLCYVPRGYIDRYCYDFVWTLCKYRIIKSTARSECLGNLRFLLGDIRKSILSCDDMCTLREVFESIAVTASSLFSSDGYVSTYGSPYFPVEYIPGCNNAIDACAKLYEEGLTVSGISKRLDIDSSAVRFILNAVRDRFDRSNDDWLNTEKDQLRRDTLIRKNLDNLSREDLIAKFGITEFTMGRIMNNYQE